MKKTCFQQDNPLCFMSGVVGFFLVPMAILFMTHLVCWTWDLTMKTPLRIVVSSIAAAAGVAWLIWFWFFDPFEDDIS